MSAVAAVEIVDAEPVALDGDKRLGDAPVESRLSGKRAREVGLGVGQLPAAVGPSSRMRCHSARMMRDRLRDMGVLGGDAAGDEAAMLASGSSAL